MKKSKEKEIWDAPDDPYGPLEEACYGEPNEEDSFKSEEPRKKKGSKRSLITSCCLALLAASIGVGVTYTLNSHLLQNQTIYAGDFAALEDDEDALMARYASSNGDYDSFRPYELVNISLHNFDASEKHYSQVKGSVLAMGVTQTIYGTSIRNGSEFFNESLSTSTMVKVAKRFYQEGEKVATFTGDIIDSTSASWPTLASESNSLKEYEEKWGKDLSRGSIYIISSKTVLSESKEVDESGNYRITVNLDPSLATVRYVKQMVSMSGLSRNPIFYSLTLEFTLDKDLKPLKSTFLESYDVYMIVTARSEGEQHTVYRQDESHQIPDGDMDIDYSIFD